MKLTLGFSPCPNDTFIFDALVNKKIDTKGLDFDIVLEDVQTLNQWALQGKLDFSKISYGVLPLIVKNYIVLNSGGALGKGVGPLLITKHEVRSTNDEVRSTNENINDKTIAIPGENTTAHLLFSLAYPNAKKKIFMKFNEIEDWVLNSSSIGGGREEAAGVIIHENRFTYHLKGLHKIVDLGEYWEQQLNVPIPLGGIVAKRNLNIKLIKQVDELIKQSVEYAFKHHHKNIAGYVQCHAQEMSEDVMRKHIDLYVNNYSTGLGNDGKKAVLKLLEVYGQIHPEIKISDANIFVD